MLRKGSVSLYAIDNPLYPWNSMASSFSQFLLQAYCAEAVSAFSIPYGNDMHFPSVFGKGRLYIVPEGYFCILELV